MPDSAVVFDYAEPFENYPAERRAGVMAVAERAAARGEPWLSLFDPAEMSEMLREGGFAEIEDLGMAALAERFYGPLRAHAGAVPARTWCGPRGGVIPRRNPRGARWTDPQDSADIDWMLPMVVSEAMPRKRVQL